MAGSSRRFRNSTSRGIAATSAIALALGGLSVVGPGPLASSAAASEGFTGGIRDKSGAVEEDAQQASDLPAGSCVVESGEPSGNQAGFRWNTLEPSEQSPDKTLWGLSVSFDNSKDRTFADWYFSNSGNLKNVLNTGQVSSMEAGQTFVDSKVTHKADEIIDITASGRDLRNLNLYAELTDEKVKQFASASADDPVRYAWQSNYKQYDPNAPKATEGSSATFGATVNPWPSENIECNPITVSWGTTEVSEKHVIVPGEETKVGTINVPALQNGGTDDSMSRMVVEAYDGNGKFIGTTDQEASGGEQLLRVDETTGDIFFTWPEYRGTDLATDKNVNFSVLAKPRTVEQLQSAAKHSNEFGEEMAFDSSNSLTRYSKANVIDSKAFSLDDTEYHDPKYDKTDASIISGVDSATGPLATEPQKVEFKQVPDLIKDLMKDKGDGGFEAKVSLDEKYVYEGWNVEMDGDYNVTVTAPENPKPGTFARPVVTVEYSNGSTDELELLVVVDPNNTQVTDLVRPSLTKGIIGDDLTAQIRTKSIMKGHKPVHPAKFEVDESTVPEGWTVTVDATGKVTAKADDTVAPGTIITPTVKATYPDETTDEIEPQFQAIVDIKIPDYDTVTNKPNAKVTLQPSVPEVGLSGNTTDEAPKRYTFEDGTTEYTHTDDSGTWTVKIDENTGAITTTIPKTAPEGYILDIPVLAHYDDEDPQKVKGTVVVLKGDIAPVYSVESTGPNQAVDHQVEDAPEGSTFSFGTNPDGSPITEMTTEDGWKYTIDPNTGVVTSTPPAGSKPGDKKTITVTVETPNGERPEVPVTTVVQLTNSWEAEPSYPEETVYPGDTATLPVTLDKPEDVNVATNNPYELGDVPQGWTVNVDNDGKITATAPVDAEPGSTVEIPVTVTYEDGSKDTVKAVVNVVDVPTRPVPFGVEYVYDDTIPAGEYKTVTKGVAGEEKQKRDGTWEQTAAPTNEVVHVGTKPATASKDVTWTAPIPYSTTTRPNPALAPGETKVVQQGVNGERTYTAKFTATGDQASVVESEDTKQPVEEIIEYGPRLDNQELVTETTRKIPFETTIVYDNTLEAGTQVVDRQGVVGEETVTSTQKLVDGRPSGDPVVTTETTKPKQDAVIRVGTKTEGETTKTVETTVPFGVKVEFDPNMPAGTSETVTEGKPGKKTITVTQKVTNSQPDGKATVEEKITEQPVDQVIKVGTKPSEASAKVTWTAPVPFEVETRPNSELKPGEIRVVQKGVPGEKTYTADFAAKGSDATVTPKEEQTKAPVKEIIEYGPRLDDQNLVTTVTKPVPFETEIVFDDSLDSGKQEVKQAGKLGEDTVTSTQKLVDGKPSGDPVVETTRTEEPVKQIIRVGTKTKGANTVEHTEPVPFETKVEYDPNVPAGTYEVVTPGKAGEKTVTVSQTIVNSQVTETKREENVTTQPVTEVITVGTKQATATDKVEWTEPIPFSTVVRPNPDLKPGEVKTVQEGVNGEAKYTATFEGTNGQATVTESKDRTEPTDRIIEYGPTIADQTLTSTTTNPVPFNTTFVADPNLPAGEQVVDKQGENGVDTITSTQEIKDGKPVGEPTITTQRTKEPVDAVVRVGTKTEGANTVEHTEPVPYETKVEYDPNVPAGTYKVVTPGKAGEKTVKVTQTIVNSQVTETKREENVTTQPVTEVITVGTKQATATDKVEWTEPIPFSTVVRPNPDLKPGEVKTVQEGVNGEAKYTATFEGTNGQATVTESKDRTEPTDKIVEYGPTIADQTLTSTTTNPVPFNTTFVADPNLPAGEQVVDKQGVNGVDTVTATQEIKDGKPVGEPTITTQRTKEPVDAVVRLGTKTEGQTVNTYEAPIPFPVRVVYDPNLAPGDSKVTQEGKPGTKKVTITQPVVNSAPNGEATVAEETVTEPTEQIVTVGTKPDEATNTATWTVDVPFKTVVRANPNLKPGDVKTVQEGEYGEKTFTADFSSVGADSTVTPTEEVTRAPKDQIIEYGPTIDDQTLTSETTRPIEFETEFILDDTLAAGEQKVDQQGENGVETITSTQEIKDGQPVGEPSISTEQTKAPTNAVIRVGTMTNGTHELTEKQPIPFDTKIEYDPEIPAGEYQVVTEGKVGEKTTTITQTIVNSKVTETERGEEKVTTEPVTQVIKVGTKQATASEDVTWTEPIPYPTVLRVNGDLAPGEIKVVQEGVDGEATYTASFTGTNGEAAVEETKRRTEPVEKIVEYGPRLEAQELVTETEKPVPFDTEIVFDDTLAAGDQVVDTQGEYGTDVVTSTQKLVDGKPSGDPTVTTERTKEPVNAKIRVGTKTTGETVNSVEAEIPFPTRIVYDPTLAPGESKVTQEGVPGTMKVTVTQPVENSQPKGEATSTEEVLTPPTEQIIAVGTKPDEATEQVTWTAPVPFDTEVRPNPALKPGEVKVVTEGVLGEKTFTADFSSKGSDATVTPKEEQTKDPVDALIEYGPTIADQTLTSTTTNPVPFNTRFVADDTLPAGEQVVEKQGVNGVDTITSTQEIKDGKPVGEPAISTERTTEPQDAVIRVGTKTTGENTETYKAEAPYNVVVKYDPNMPAGESKVTTPGVPGEKTVTIKRDIVNSKPGDPQITEEITKQPVDEVITVGTKPSDASKKVTWTAQVPFEVETRPNPELKPGEIKVAQQGVPGEKTYTADFAAKGTEATVTPEEKQTKDPVNEIIEYGPAPKDTSVVTKVEKPVPFETEIIFDDTLAEGEQVVDQQGELGTDVVTSTQKLVDGKPSGDPTVTTERAKEPVNAVIRVGTKTTGETSETVTSEVPFGVKVVLDPDMPAGASEIVTEGVPGEKTVTIKRDIVNSKPGDPQITEEITKDPVDQVMKVGTKPSEASEKVSWTAPVPFEVETRPNPELKPGEIRVVQKGVPGEKTYTADFSATGDQATVAPEEKQTKAPVKEIIEYGPAPEDTSVVTKVEKPVPFETEIVFDDTLAEGDQVVDQQGELGTDVVTSTQQIVDGKPSGDPTVTTERTKEPTNAVIRVGTKKSGDVVSSFEAPIEPPVKIEYDPNLPAGTSEVAEEGTPGKKKVTVTQPSTNGVADGEPTVTEETIDEAKPRVIKVGTKQATASEDVTWTEPIPYPTVLRANGDLAPGEIKVVQEGVDGEATYTATFTGTNGEAAVEETKRRTEPVEKIVEYGPRLEAQELVTTTEKPVPFDTEIVFDDTLAAGEQVVDTQGEYGTDVVTSTQKLVDGKPSGDPVVNTERAKEPVNAVIRVGTKTGDTRVVEEKVSVPFETVIEYDPAIPAGEYKVAAEGVPGEKIVTVTQTIVNSQVTDTKRDETITTAPQPRIIKVGTKQPEAGENVTWTEPIPFTTEFRENPDLAPGETKVVQEGKDGEATYYVEFKTNGESATVENTNQRVEPVNRIVEYGPRANDDEISTQLTRPIEFKTSVIYDDTLEEGKQVITQGELGEEVVTTTHKLVDGSPSGEPVTTTQVTKAPVNAVIRIGTKKPSTPDPAPEVSETVDLPFTTKIVYDPTLEPGQEIEDVAGENGQVKVTVVNGRATVETVKEPVQRVVRVGTKPAGDVEWTEEIPFEVVVRENPELTRDQSRIAQEGVPGLKQVVNGEEQIVREPVDYILEVGTKATVAKPEYSLVTLQPGQTANIQPANAVKGNQYRKLDWPKGWEGTVDPETGEVRVITPADAKPGTEVELPVEVTDVNGVKSTVHAKVKVMDKDVVPTPNKQGSSDKAKRCLENAFAANSPFLWLLPIALLGAVGYGVNEAFGPQIQQVSAQINEQVRRNIPDFGIGHGFEQPEWMRQINAQVDAINRQFAPVAKQLEPLGIALGAIAAISLTGVLIAQACTEEGFDNGMTVLGSSKS